MWRSLDARDAKRDVTSGYESGSEKEREGEERLRDTERKQVERGSARVREREPSQSRKLKEKK